MRGCPVHSEYKISKYIQYFMQTSTYHPRCTHVLQNLRVLNNDLLLGSCGQKDL